MFNNISQNNWDIAQLKEAVSISEMARMLSLSRQRFYSLLMTKEEDFSIKQGVFPMPVYDIRTKRPYYTKELQLICLNVRRTNRGVNGQNVFFYSKLPRPPKTAKKKSSKPMGNQNGRHAELSGMLKQLGMETTPNKVASAIREVFPDGIPGVKDDILLRKLYRHLR